jgi:hypothetical protein
MLAVRNKIDGVQLICIREYREFLEEKAAFCFHRKSPNYSSISITAGGQHRGDKKTVHKYEWRGCDDVLIWFGGPPNKSFQGPHVCCPLPSPLTLGHR